MNVRLNHSPIHDGVTPNSRERADEPKPLHSEEIVKLQHEVQQLQAVVAQTRQQLAQRNDLFTRLLHRNTE